MKRFIILGTYFIFFNGHCIINDVPLPNEWNTLSNNDRYQILINAGGTLDRNVWDTMPVDIQYETLFDLMAENNRALQPQENNQHQEHPNQEQWQRMTNDQRYAHYLEQIIQNNTAHNADLIDEETWQTVPVNMQYDIVYNQQPAAALQHPAHDNHANNHHEPQNNNPRNNQQNQQIHECNICMDDKPNTVTMTCCKDKIICKDCLIHIIADAQNHATAPTCPYCRQEINQQLQDRLINLNNN